MISAHRFVPVARPGRSVGEGRVPRAREPFACLGRPAVAAALLWASGVQAAGPVAPALPPKGMPQPCAGGACGTAPGASTPFVSNPTNAANPGGTASWSYNSQNNTLTVQQNVDRAILNWSNFDVAPGGRVSFLQPGASSATLNRIWQANPSMIQGQITAPGQVYLLNQNGIVFGSGAQVNVGALLASTLNLRDQDFLGSLFTSYQQGLPLLSNLAADGTSYTPGAISVEKGAVLQTSGTGGRIFLAAPNVTNAGTLSAPDGQVAMAAGNLVYVTSDSTNSQLRGLTIAIDQGGIAQNLGNVISQRGNVTIAGLTVNQSGLVRATSSVNFNGSVYLVAGEKPTLALSRGTIPTHGGDLTLGAGSATQVLPELSDTATSLDSQTLTPGIVSLQGRNVHLVSGASVTAPGAQVSIRARDRLTSDDSTRETGTVGSVVIDDGAVIDVSGTQNVDVSVARNFVDVQLRSNELQDSPVQRGGFLQGKTVTVDLRGVGANGNIPIANISGFTTNVGRTIAERTSAGGTIDIASSGSIVARQNATLNVSGGSIAYSGAAADTTKLIGANGKVYDIMTAPKDMVYVGFANSATRTQATWGLTQTWQGGSKPFVPGYVEGRDAGSVALLAPTVVLDGSVKAATVRGPFQRNLGGAAANPNQTPPGPSQAPLGGSLTIGDASAAADAVPDFQLRDVTLGGKATPLDPTITYDDIVAGKLPAGPTQIALPSLIGSGVSRIAVYSNGNVTLTKDASARLPLGGSLTLEGGRVSIEGDVVAPSGTVTATAIATNDTGTATPLLSLASGALVDVRGSWVNDSLTLGAIDRTTVKSNDGGSVAFKSMGDLTLGAGSAIDVSGGGYLGTNNVLTSGKAGSISLRKVGIGPGSVTLGGALRGYGLAKGGSLTLSAPSVTIGGTSSDPAALALDAGFFSRGGFASYNVTGIDGVAVAPGTIVDARASNYLPGLALATLKSGGDLASLAPVALLPDAQRANPISITLAAADQDQAFTKGAVSVGRGARISTDPGGSIALVSPTAIDVEGTLSAPAGSIRLAIDPNNVTSGVDISSYGFRPSQSIWLGSQAQLLAMGAALVSVDKRGLRSGGLVNDGGSSITLDAGRGYLVSEAGSIVDVSGTTAVVDLPGTGGQAAKPVTLAGSAGTVNLSASAGMLLDGSLAAHAGGPGGAGGTLSVSFGQKDNYGFGNVLNLDTPLPTAAHRIVLQQGGTLVAAGLAPGAAIDTATYAGVATVKADTIVAAGFDSVALQSKDAVVVRGDVGLQLKRSLTIDTPILTADAGARATLDAAYVALGSADVSQQPAAPVKTAPTGATLALRGNLVDVVGDSVVAGFDSVSLASTRDIRLIGTDKGTLQAPSGSLAVSAPVVLDAAQVYPTTLTQFALSSTDRVAFANSAGAIGATPYSAGGSLTVSAPVIDQQGTLRVPLGNIAFAATNTLTIGATSLTSVAADGLTIPFGTTQNGSAWVYSLKGGDLPISAPPSKAIELGGPSVTVKGGARIDLSGGGDLYAYEFVPGTGGSKDVLAAPNVFAIVPTGSLAHGAASYDPLYSGGTTLRPGDSITLAGGGPVPAGTYTLLPARYALLPGAYAITAVSGTLDMLPGSAISRTDGSVVIAGRRSVGGSDVVASRWSGWQLTPSATVRTQSEYDDSLASTFFANLAAKTQLPVPTLPADAGDLVLRASGVLSLAPDTRFSFASGHGGHGGEVDLAAARVALVNTRNDADPGLAGYLQVEADALSGIGAERIVLGGSRSPTDAGALRVDATSVEVRNDGAHPLVAPDIVLAATGQIAIRDGAVLSATAVSKAVAADLATSGDGALVRLTASALPGFSRSGATGAAGDLTVGANTTLKALGSVTLDAGRNMTLDPTATLDAPALRVDANRIALGVVPAGTAGLALDPGTLTRASRLVLQSPTSIDFYGALDLGGTTPLGDVTFDAPALRAMGAGDRGVVARTITLQDSSGGVGGTGIGSGTLALTARSASDGTGGDVIVGAGARSLSGFDSVGIAADRGIVLRGTGSTSTAGSLSLSAAAVTSEAGADQSLVATGALRVSGNGQPATYANASAAGGSLTLTGASVDVSGNLSLPAGTVVLHAVGGGAGSDVAIRTGARVGAPGFLAAFHDASATAAGGTLSLVSDHGNVVVENGATLDVSAAAGGDAGSLSLSAPLGAVSSAGTLKGGADRGRVGGSLSVDSGSLTAVDVLAFNAAATTAGGFTEAYALRARSGDLALGATESILARNVTFTADQGAVAIAGRIDASGSGDRPDAGTIALWSGNAVRIAPGASLTANAASGGGAGRISLGTTSASGTLDLAAGSAVGLGGGGTLLLRAPRTGAGAGTDVAIGTIGSDVQGASRVVLEAVKTYDGIASVDASTLATVAADDSAFYANAGATLARVTGTNAALGALAHLRSGVELRNAGAMTVAQALDLSTLRDGSSAEPGMLTLRAGGNLTLAGSMSDGFTVARGTATVNAGDSWSYRLVAGADLTGANPMAVATTRGTGSLTLSPTAVVRTGTGSIEAAAAGDVVFSRSGSQAASMYTAGTIAPDLTGQFTNPNYTSELGGKVVAQYTEGGGDVSVSAGGDVVGSGSTQLVNAWLYRQGQLNASGRYATAARQPVQTSWWVAFDQFGQDVGALGGGNVTVRAGGSVRDLSAAVPTNGRLALGRTTDSAGPDIANLVVKGGGNLAVVAAGDVLGGSYYVARGTGSIVAGGRIGADVANALQIAPVFALGDARMTVDARRDANVTTAYDPFFAPQSLRSQMGPGTTEDFAGARQSYFESYSAASRLEVRSTAGDANLGADYGTLLNTLTPTDTYVQALSSNYDILPPTLTMTALQGNVGIARDATLAPSATGNLRLLAGKSINLGPATLVLSDVDPSTIAGAARPVPVPNSGIGGSLEIRNEILGNVNPWLGHAPTPLHENDTTPVVLDAQTGSVTGAGNAATRIVVGKPILIAAATDVSGISVYAQNLRASDVSAIEAGRDIVQPPPRSAVNNALLPDDSVISISGPGRLEVVAGRNIDLGTSEGILTTGNTYNPALPSAGASIGLIAGIGAATSGAAQPAYNAFAARYLDPAGPLAGGTGYEPRLVSYVSGLLGVDPATLDSASAYAAFVKLPAAQQAALIEQVLGAELRQAGLDHNTKGASYQRGYDAIAALFPGSSYAGDITLYYSQVKTLRGGDISMMTPGGGVNAGLAVTPTGGVTKSPTELGIVTAASGSIRAVTDGNFQVNSSRVFTVGGGDVLMWSSRGNIDAGKGAKSTVLVPPPLVQIDSSGKVTITLQGAASGAGIGALLSGPGQLPGNVDLIAPVGEVNAGDAGIRAAGNLNIAAQVVRGADNISFGGVATGVPVADTSGLSAGLAGASVGKDASRSTEETTKRIAESAQAGDEMKKAFRPTFITVEVTSLGDDEDDPRKKRK